MTAEMSAIENVVIASVSTIGLCFLKKDIKDIVGFSQ